ncbi:hypothetical protein CLFO_17040 [Clostridium formicaceticum]|uniref:Uncharacterized protein n=1 Tax=Clostridium formicaceticum TaxID=1497 RepID=A0AAC9RN48_9CLOT|nr:hypothetical protein CLFO_17040 [Clostridium formicaceticum]
MHSFSFFISYIYLYFLKKSIDFTMCKLPLAIAETCKRYTKNIKLGKKGIDK